VLQVLPGMIEKLGDNKQPVRDAAMASIEVVMAVVGAAEVFERMLGAFGHKAWRLREQLAIFVQRTLAEGQAGAVPLADVVPLVAKLLNDQQPAVRTAAMNALVELYRTVGDKLRRDLEKHKIRPAQMKQLVERFDEIGGGGGDGDAQPPIGSGGDPAFSDPPAMGGSMGSSSGSGGSARAGGARPACFTSRARRRRWTGRIQGR
jgi:CLIP-associating protein 1/2